MNFQVERLRCLPRRSAETWQGGVFKMLMWVEQEDGDLVRPWIAGWISLKTRLLHLSEPRTEEADGLDAALRALADFACNQQLAGYRPGKLQVKDPALAEYLREMLAGLDIEVELRGRLVVLEQVLMEMVRHLSEGPPAPDAMDAKGVTVDSMRAFADAAAEFYRAEPWEYLSSNDLIEIESPSVEAGLRCATILGAGGDTFGLGFYRSRQEFQSLLEDPRFMKTGEHWSVLFGPIHELPFGDVDLWEDHDLSVAGKNAYPLAICFRPGGKHHRPGVDLLAFLEGLLRALARTTEDQIDTGRWKEQVETFRGPMEFTLALPDLLETAQEASPKRKPSTHMFNPLATEGIMADIEKALESREFESEEEINAFLRERFPRGRPHEREPTTPQERAQDLVYRAYEAAGRKRIQMARQALEISPDCADAYILLAEGSSDLEKQLDYYIQAVQTAERTLDPDLFEKEAGHFWGIVKTRPYMRARLGVAECLEDLGRLEEAAGHYRELLRLNPDDNQGVRSNLWLCLLRLGEDDEVDTLLKQFKNDKGTCVWNYTRALLTFRQKGDTPTARKHLRQAIEDNKFVVDYLLGEKLPPGPPVPYQLGSEEEAIACVDLLRDAWSETPGALDWLEQVLQRL